MHIARTRPGGEADAAHIFAPTLGVMSQNGVSGWAWLKLLAGAGLVLSSSPAGRARGGSLGGGVGVFAVAVL